MIPRRLVAAFDGDRDRLGERIATTYLELWDDPETGRILQSMVRTAMTSERSASLLREVLAGRILANLPDDVRVGDEVSLRVLLCGTHLLGIAIARNIVGIEPVAGMDREHIVELVAPTIQRYLTGLAPR